MRIFITNIIILLACAAFSQERAICIAYQNILHQGNECDQLYNDIIKPSIAKKSTDPLSASVYFFSFLPENANSYVFTGNMLIRKMRDKEGWIEVSMMLSKSGSNETDFLRTVEITGCHPINDPGWPKWARSVYQELINLCNNRPNMVFIKVLAPDKEVGAQKINLYSRISELDDKTDPQKINLYYYPCDKIDAYKNRTEYIYAGLTDEMSGTIKYNIYGSSKLNDNIKPAQLITEAARMINERLTQMGLTRPK